MGYEYKVIPAPRRTKHSKSVKDPVERLALALSDDINNMASRGWEFVRSETLTVQHKPGRLSKIVELIETVLVFRRQQSLQTMQATETAGQSIVLPETSEKNNMTQAKRVSKTPEPKAAIAVEPDMPTSQMAVQTEIDPDEAHAPNLGGATRD